LIWEQTLSFGLINNLHNCQRVVRKIHEECKEAYTPDPKIVQDVQTELGNLLRAQGKLNSIKVRETLIVEIQDILENWNFRSNAGDRENRKAYSRKSIPSDIEKQAKEEGMITLKQMDT
jgi:type II secretory ATPase GspE/PulE/Tfp pilus assembly ATPase PilB-like protein